MIYYLNGDINRLIYKDNMVLKKRKEKIAEREKCMSSREKVYRMILSSVLTHGDAGHCQGPHEHRGPC
jgi:hypothetical protein